VRLTFPRNRASNTKQALARLATLASHVGYSDVMPANIATVAGNHTQRVTGVGECRILVPTIHGGRSCRLHLRNVMLVPESPFNLISIVRLETAGVGADFGARALYAQRSGERLCSLSADSDG
jgi:hypothetical protein